MKRKFSPSIVGRVSGLAATASILILVAVLSNCGGKSQPPPPALTMGPPSLPNLSVGVPTGPADLVINANGGVAPYNWSVSAGSLPHSISLSPFPPGSPANGGFVALSGTPDTAARVNFTIQVTDSARQSASQAYTVAVLLNGDLFHGKIERERTERFGAIAKLVSILAPTAYSGQFVFSYPLQRLPYHPRRTRKLICSDPAHHRIIRVSCEKRSHVKSTEIVRNLSVMA